MSGAAYYCCRTAAVVAEHYGIPMLAIFSRTRGRKAHARARMMAMYLANVVYGVNFSHIAPHFGRDRTTVAHAVQEIEDLRDNSDFDAILDRLERHLGQEALAA